MNDKTFGFFDDDGTKINPDLIKNQISVLHVKKDDDPSEEIYVL